MGCQEQVAAAAEAEAKKHGATVVIVVVDDGGNLILLERLDDTQVERRSRYWQSTDGGYLSSSQQGFRGPGEERASSCACTAWGNASSRRDSDYR